LAGYSIGLLACRLDWPVRTISFSHDGKLIASASEDLVIDIGEVETGEKVCRSKTGTFDTNPSFSSQLLSLNKGLIAMGSTVVTLFTPIIPDFSRSYFHFYYFLELKVKNFLLLCLFLGS